jgi:glycerophosphoryl diester phosphodiesterase
MDAMRQLRTAGTVVVAHRGDSRHQDENTLSAFRAALQHGIRMQEFDVQATRDQQLVCLHDPGLDRTTDAARVLGPGALVAQLRADELVALRTPRGERIPSLAAALAVMLPECIPLIEHKSGAVDAYLKVLAECDTMQRCILQSFDWEFVAAVHRQAPQVALAVLGPTTRFPQLDDACVAAAQHLGAGMIHWDADQLTSEQVRLVHAASMLVCSYTTDTEAGMLGLIAMGVDAFCTNDPGLGSGCYSGLASRP